MSTKNLPKDKTIRLKKRAVIVFFRVFIWLNNSNKISQRWLIIFFQEGSWWSSWITSSASSPSPSGSRRKEYPDRCRPWDPGWACRTSPTGRPASTERPPLRRRSSRGRVACDKPRRNWGRASRPLPEEGSWKILKTRGFKVASQSTPEIRFQQPKMIFGVNKFHCKIWLYAGIDRSKQSRDQF